MNIQEYAAKKDIQTCMEIDPALLVPEDRIRAFCVENKCQTYGKNYMCPPHIGTIDELKQKVAKYRHCLLLQHIREMPVTKENVKQVAESKKDFHHAILSLERHMARHGVEDVWALVGGNCGICKTCRAVEGEKPCRHPSKARASLEAIGVDVIGLLDKLGMDSGFHEDKITWTGCILYNED